MSLDRQYLVLCTETYCVLAKHYHDVRVHEALQAAFREARRVEDVDRAAGDIDASVRIHCCMSWPSSCSW
jgi:hypothetical protein